MKTLYGFLIACCMLIAQHGYSQNNALHFDGVCDHISLPLVLTGLNGNPANFTFEAWVRSENSPPGPGNTFRRFFSFSGTNTRFEVGENGANIILFAQSPGTVSPVVTIAPFTVNTWTHIAVVKSGANLDFYLDCSHVGSFSLVGYTFAFDQFFLGKWVGTPAPSSEFLGTMDEVRLWTSARTPAQICSTQFCPLSCAEPNLFLQWNFDDGQANGNNTAMTQVTDCSPNGLNGNIAACFTLTGTVSNFVPSTTQMTFPALHNLGLEIRDYPYRNNLLTGICDGEPVHICLDDNGQTPGPYANVTVQWESSDDAGTTWTPITTPSFLDFCFPVAPNEIIVPCPGNSDGFVDRKYRAISTVTGPTSAQCTYVSDEYDLQICCPISVPTLSITPNGPFCEGDAATFNVFMTSPDPFVTTPGPNVTIDWYFVDPFNSTRTLVHSGAGSFTYSHTFPSTPGAGPGPDQYIFEVEITNCQGKFGLFSACVSVDPQPECGTIEGSPLGSPQNLNFVTASSHLTYEICPGNDAILEMATPFIDCIPQWQYTFDDPAVVAAPAWVNIGFSNSVQNTNILPSYYWPAGTTSIYYRIECQPLPNPFVCQSVSGLPGCDPCYSDWIEIQLIQAPVAASISGLNQVCLEDLPITLSVVAPVTGVTYNWVWNGLPIGTGATQQVTEAGCYWLEVSNGCQTTVGPQHCVEVCETIAVISCPLVPNECAELDEPITLSACDSENTCSGNTGNTLNYLWSTGATTCTITDTPAAAGTTYSVTVTDPTTGCVGITQRTVVPCDLNE